MEVVSNYYRSEHCDALPFRVVFKLHPGETANVDGLKKERRVLRVVVGHEAVVGGVVGGVAADPCNTLLE